VSDSVARGNGYQYGMTRNVQGTTTATRFDTDSSVSFWKGTINRTSGANISLNEDFLGDPRWKQEMCAGAGVSRGFCGSTANLASYVGTKAGISVSGGGQSQVPSPPSGLRITQ
jgi:hypothetical protein